jgi:hypothetical protein
MELEDSYLMMLSRSTLKEKTSDHQGTCKNNTNFATEQKFSEQVNLLAQVERLHSISDQNE